MKVAKTRKTSVKKTATPLVVRQDGPTNGPATPPPTLKATAPATSLATLKAAPAATLATPPAPLKATPAPTPMTPPAAPKVTSPARPVTVIEAKIDVGFGNQLFVRGQGAGLSWERGTPLTCVAPDTWRWTVEATDRLQFKLLLNDRVWAKGEDVVVPPGKQVELKPAFSE